MRTTLPTLFWQSVVNVANAGIVTLSANNTVTHSLALALALKWLRRLIAAQNAAFEIQQNGGGDFADGEQMLVLLKTAPTTKSRLALSHSPWMVALQKPATFTIFEIDITNDTLPKWRPLLIPPVFDFSKYQLQPLRRGFFLPTDDQVTMQKFATPETKNELKQNMQANAWIPILEEDLNRQITKTAHNQ